ncbi:MAG: hypothetical protein ACTHN5_09855 [Phycisphaerae bacterium]
MNQDPTDTGLDLAAEVRQLRTLLERELAATRAQMAAAAEAEGAMRAQRDQLRHTQVSTEVRLMEMQRDLVTAVEKGTAREEERWAKLAAAAQEITGLRLELARAGEQLARAEAIARNAQSEVVQYEAAQRAQVARLGELEPLLGGLQGRVAELEQSLQVLGAKAAKEKAAYEAQARELIKKRKELEARVTELAGARSRRLLMKLRLVSRCAWEK